MANLKCVLSLQIVDYMQQPKAITTVEHDSDSQSIGSCTVRAGTCLMAPRYTTVQHRNHPTKCLPAYLPCAFSPANLCPALP